MEVLAKDDDKLDSLVAGLDPTGIDSTQGNPSLNLDKTNYKITIISYDHFYILFVGSTTLGFKLIVSKLFNQ